MDGVIEREETAKIDGSFGEGGGQILRSSLTLSLITGKALTISNIRARRPKPGLMAQHLRAVEAAAAVGQANVEGAQPGSIRLVFTPGHIRPGKFEFDIRTAGSTSLVLQTILLPLSLARQSSSVAIRGGTHVPWSPSFHYLILQWRPYLQKIGFNFHLEMERAGFYPQGGGRLVATVHPGGELQTLQLTDRGRFNRIRGISAVANLDVTVAERQKQQALKRLQTRFSDVEIRIEQMPSRFKGTMLLLIAEFENSQACYFALGQRGKPAERVADEAVDMLDEFLESDGAIDQYLADQLLLPLALAPGISEFRTSEITQHLLTNAEVIRKFLTVDLEVEGVLGTAGLIRVKGTSLRC